MRNQIALVLAFAAFTLSTKASHVIGGQMHYDYLGNDMYQVTLTLYRDCSSNTQYDDPLHIGIFNSAGDQVDNLSIALQDAIVTTVTPESYSACYVAPLDLCIEEAIFSTTVELPLIPGGYTLTYQRCCRNFSIVNVPTGTDVGITLTTDIPGSESVAVNSNPEFETRPPFVICLNAPFVFDHSAIDADGDELHYELCAPLNVNVNGSYITNPGAPPYPPLSYNAGYSATYPLDANPPFAIDEYTGLLTGTATALGQYVLGICISEYRDGVLINVTNRDIQLNVTTCSPTSAPAISDQVDVCSGLTVEFLNESIEDLTYHWDFGDTAIDTDTSNVYAPTYTYSSPGAYDVMLVLNPGLPCADTTFSTYISSPSLLPAIASVTHDCVDGQLEFSFAGDGGTDATTTFNWNFGASANPSTSTTANTSGVQFSTGGSTVNVSLSVSQDGCTESTSLDIEIPAAIISDIQGQTTFCDGYTYAYTNLSQNATSYVWDFGAPGSADISYQQNPSYTYQDTGLYQVRLIASAENVCPDTSYTSMLIYGLLDPFFAAPAAECYVGNSFDFHAEGASTDVAIYQWDFNAAGIPQFSSQQSPQNVHFNTSGDFDVSVTITENDCIETYTSQVEVIANPQFSALADTLAGCLGITAHFQNTSLAESPVTSEWDFGDGTTGTGMNVSHGYEQPGTYDVLLNTYTTSGCIELQTFQFNNVVQIDPLPVAGFELSAYNVSLLDPTVDVTDESIGSVSCMYYFSDGGVVDDCDFEYSFLLPGTITIEQVVTSSAGCTARAVGSAYVEGFAFYAPNAFTPDNDGLNDVWMPSVFGVTKYDLKIFDRWGEQIFQTNDPKQPWTGNVNGGKYFAVNDVYTYQVVVEDLLGLPKDFRGHIVLVR